MEAEEFQTTPSRASRRVKALLQEECAEDITTYKDEVERLWRICGGKPDKRQSQDVTIRAPPERIFDALTNPKRRTQWWGKPDYQGAQMESDLRADGRWVQSGEWRNGKSFQVAGVYRTVDRAHLLAFSWRSCTDKSGLESLVQFDLKEENGNTTVRVTQSGPEGTLLPERRWEEVLASLRKYVEGPTAS